jgi:hypothetical protein
VEFALYCKQRSKNEYLMLVVGVCVPAWCEDSSVVDGNVQIGEIWRWMEVVCVRCEGFFCNTDARMSRAGQMRQLRASYAESCANSAHIVHILRKCCAYPTQMLCISYANVFVTRDIRRSKTMIFAKPTLDVARNSRTWCAPKDVTLDICRYIQDSDER